MKIINSAKLLIIVGSEILVVWHSDTHPRRAHGMDIPGGVIEDGEMIEEGLAREVQEETGLTLDMRAAQILHSATSLLDGMIYIHHIYAISLDTKPEIVLSWEHGRMSWEKLEAIDELDDHYQQGVDFARHHNLLQD